MTWSAMCPYRCRARERGYEPCGQGFIDVEDLDEHVVAILSNLTIPDGFRERMEAAVRARVEHQAAFERMQEIQAIIERVDFRWDRGYIEPDEYLDKRGQLEAEMESLRPIDYDELIEAADLIEHFRPYWEQCDRFDNPEEARQQLMAQIVDRVFVYDDRVIAIALHPDFGVVLDVPDAAPSDVMEAVSWSVNERASVSSDTRTQNGSDGDRSRSGSIRLVFIPPYAATDQVVDLDWSDYLRVILSSL
jgi:hypothetical protein